MDRPLKICLVSPFDYGFPGGVNDHVRHLAAQFKTWGHSVYVIAPCASPSEIVESNFIPMGKPVPIPSNGSIARISLSIWLRPRIKQVLNEHDFDIVHLHNPLSGLVPTYILGQSKAVNIATFHLFGGEYLFKTGKMLGGTKFAMRYLKNLHGRIAVSEANRDYINQYFPGSYEVIPNGIQLDEFSGDIKPFPHLRDGMINILWVGRLEKRKGLKYLLGAYGKLKWQWPNLRLLVVGPGNPDVDSIRIMSERNLQDIVFTGEVSPEDKIRYYKSADIYCSPATGKESFGIVLLEAMAAGKPIVASSIPGFSSVVTNGREGLLVPPKDDNALAEAIDKLLKNADLRNELAENGKQKVQEFRWDKVAQKVMDYYTVCMKNQIVKTS